MTVPTSPVFFDIEPARSRLLSDLWSYQLKDGCISQDAIRALANQHEVSEIEIKGVASFYHFFHPLPAGKHIIYLNDSIISQIQGYDRIKQAFEHETGALLGSCDPTGTFGLYHTSCIGLSDHEPAALIDFHPFINLNVLKVKGIIQALKEGKTASEIADTPGDNIRYTAHDKTIFFAPYKAGEAIKQLTTLSQTDVIDLIRKSELSGRGGAFFPTWKKWDTCRQYSDAPKFIVCNADEGEPGTFKDRVLINNKPGSILEGMIIAGYAVGASYGIIYLRGEYRWLSPKIKKTIADFYENRLLGKNIMGIADFHFDIRVEVGAGAYVCGEETALLESLEGRRGEPRTKWFYPVEKGYLQKPTVVNNVETFAAAARLLQLGPDEYLKRGIPGSPGTKLISISGDCQLPGIYEIEWGMTVAELLELCEAEDPHMIQVSGPSGETISMEEKYRRISMLSWPVEKDIRCGGSLMVFNHNRNLIDILLNFSEFFKRESCGVCTPCRAGNFILQRKLERVKNGLADLNDLKELTNWSSIMKVTSRCGLGKTASNSITYSLKNFQSYFNERVGKAGNNLFRGFDLREATHEYERYKP